MPQLRRFAGYAEGGVDLRRGVGLVRNEVDLCVSYATVRVSDRSTRGDFEIGRHAGFGEHAVERPIRDDLSPSLAGQTAHLVIAEWIARKAGRSIRLWAHHNRAGR